VLREKNGKEISEGKVDRSDVRERGMPTVGIDWQ